MDLAAFARSGAIEPFGGMGVRRSPSPDAPPRSTRDWRGDLGAAPKSRRGLHFQSPTVAGSDGGALIAHVRLGEADGLHGVRSLDHLQAAAFSSASGRKAETWSPRSACPRVCVLSAGSHWCQRSRTRNDHRRIRLSRSQLHTIDQQHKMRLSGFSGSPWSAHGRHRRGADCHGLRNDNALRHHTKRQSSACVLDRQCADGRGRRLSDL
jgi:hypothetical protein